MGLTVSLNATIVDHVALYLFSKGCMSQGGKGITALK